MQKSPNQEAQRFCSSVAKRLEDLAEVRTITQQSLIELKDLDELTTKEDVCEALKRSLEGAQNIETGVVKSLRNAYSGTQTAVVCLPSGLAQKALDMGKIRIGWVISRVREK